MAENRTPEVDARGITWFGVGLVALCVLSLALLALLYQYFNRREAAKNVPSIAAGMKIERGQLPPEPRLQTTPEPDLKQIRAVEDQILGSYAWVDRARGVVRIPIDRAMDLLAARAQGNAK